MDIPTRTLDELLAVCAFLQDFPTPWWIGGEWAIDIWAGAPSRDHEDIEICVFRQDQEIVFNYCAAWQPFRPATTHFVPMDQGERLTSPHFMLQFQQTSTTSAPAAMPPTFEFLLNDINDDHWIYPHNHAIQVPFDRVRTSSPYGVTVAAPEIVLAIKSWYPRPKDHHDFERVLPLLDDEQRTWLRQFLMQDTPDMPWIAALND